MGGGVMRAATKAAKAVSAAAHAPWLDTSIVPQKLSTRPSSLPLAGQQITENLISSSPASSENAAATEKIGTWKVDEWEFAGGVEEKISEPVRIVFGPVPTLDEAREATEDLKMALEDFSDNSDAQNELVPSYPKHVAQAFSFLKESSQAQEVVASLASDKNVWDAVLKNEMVLQFYKTNQINPSLEGPKTEVTINSVEPIESIQNPEENNLSGEIPRETPMDGLNSFVEFIKVKLEDIGNKVSGFVKDLMAGAGAGSASPPTASTASATATKTDGGSSDGSSAAAVDFSLAASFFALAIATILTILFKRG